MGFLTILGGILGVTVAAVYAVKLYFKFSAGVCKSKRRLDGKVAIVTGANSGIGFETAKDLARRGAKVILACRNTDAGRECAELINLENKNKNAVCKKLDLSNMASVREFCSQVLKEEDRLNILVNNAGAAGIRRTITDEGFELQFATNHFGPFLMTNILSDLMKKTGDTRVVMVSSLAHKWTKDLDLENLNSEKYWEPKLLYARTKLCNILLAKEMARRLEELKIDGITANAVNPGGVKTAIFRHARKAFKYMIMISQFFFKTPEEGAQTVVHLCVSEELDGVTGEYFTDCKRDKTSPLAEDKKLAAALWEKSASIVKLTPQETILNLH